tara:strand:- start:240 stop:551 length:312 start_codon:yes stop_codon:yes gene_type:complete
MSLTDKQIDAEFKKGNVVPYWDKKIHEELVGFTIIGARYLTDEEKEEMNWYSKAPILELRKPKSKHKYYLMAQNDDIGNDAGAFAYGCYDSTVEVENDVFPVI